MAAMTRRELLGLPTAVDLPTAGRALGIGRSLVYDLHQRGELPFRVLKLGRRLRVPREELFRVLGIESSPTAREAG